jgi:hypothetical protein
MEIAFEWQLYHDDILGDQYLPVCTIEIKTKDGEWRSEVLKVDSSADTILMDEDDCTVLGYKFDDCIPYLYHDVNRTYVKCFIQYFDVRIGGFVINDVPISFSTRPISSSLLGRSKIFDLLDICFDGKNKYTLFATK